MTLESSKISVLLGALDFNPSVGQKTVIVANAAQEVEEVFKVNPQCEAEPGGLFGFQFRHHVFLMLRA